MADGRKKWSPGTLTLKEEITVPWRTVFSLAWPAALEMSLHMVLWVVDVAMVGRLGAEALSAVGIGGQVYFTAMFMVGGSLMIGTSALVARCWGEGRRQKAGDVASRSLILSVAGGILVATLGWWGAPAVYRVANLGEQVTSLGITYLRVISLGALFFVPAMVLNGVFRGRGDTRTPLVITGIANTINIAGDYMLIFGAGPFPPLGVLGAAVAASLAGLVAALIAFPVAHARGVLKGGMPAPFLRRSSRTADARDWQLYRQILAVSTPAALEVLLMEGARTTVTLLIAVLGPVALAASQVAIAAESLSFMPGYGLAISAGILAGQSLGAGNPQRAVSAAHRSVAAGIAIMGTGGVLFFLLARPLVALFTHDGAVVAMAAPALMVAAFAQPFIATAEVMVGVFRGAGDTRAAMVITTASMWAVRVPFTYLAITRWQFGLIEVWVVMVADWVFRACVALWYFRRGGWHHGPL